jgi:hypothetical protein
MGRKRPDMGTAFADGGTRFRYAFRRSFVKVRLALVAAIALVGVSPALANGKCSFAPKSKWQPKEALQRQLESDGYNVRRIKIEGGCYEVYAFDKEGNRANMAYNAETLEKLDNPEAGEN